MGSGFAGWCDSDIEKSDLDIPPEGRGGLGVTGGDVGNAMEGVVLKQSFIPYYFLLDGRVSNLKS